MSSQMRWLFLIFLVVFAEIGYSGSTAPRIKFDTKMKDFGVVKRGEQLVAHFPFRNTGGSSLTIQGAHAPCGCTAVELGEHHSYQPGQSGEIQVRFDTTDFRGSVSKVITVLTNEPGTAGRTLVVRASVSEEITAIPPLVDFGKVSVGASAVQTFLVKLIASQSISVQSVEYDKAVFYIETQKVSEGTQIRVALRPDVAPGFIKKRIFVLNNSQQLSRLPVLVRAQVDGNIQVEPSFLEFGSVMPRRKASRVIRVQGKGPFEILKHRVELSINGEVISGASGAIQVSGLTQFPEKPELQVELTHAFDKSGSVHGKLFLETTDPLQKQIRIDFYALLLNDKG